MPGINANLSNPAFAIWDEVPKKNRRPVNSMGGPMEPGLFAVVSVFVFVFSSVFLFEFVSVFE